MTDFLIELLDGANAALSTAVGSLAEDVDLHQEEIVGKGPKVPLVRSLTQAEEKCLISIETYLQTGDRDIYKPHETLDKALVDLKTIYRDCVQYRDEKGVLILKKYSFVKELNCTRDDSEDAGTEIQFNEKEINELVDRRNAQKEAVQKVTKRKKMMATAKSKATEAKRRKRQRRSLHMAAQASSQEAMQDDEFKEKEEQGAEPGDDKDKEFVDQGDIEALASDIAKQEEVKDEMSKAVAELQAAFDAEVEAERAEAEQEAAEKQRRREEEDAAKKQLDEDDGENDDPEAEKKARRDQDEQQNEFIRQEEVLLHQANEVLHLKQAEYSQAVSRKIQQQEEWKQREAAEEDQRRKRELAKKEKQIEELKQNQAEKERWALEEDELQEKAVVAILKELTALQKAFLLKKEQNQDETDEAKAIDDAIFDHYKQHFALAHQAMDLNGKVNKSKEQLRILLNDAKFLHRLNDKMIAGKIVAKSSDISKKSIALALQVLRQNDGSVTFDKLEKECDKVLGSGQGKKAIYLLMGKALATTEHDGTTGIRIVKTTLV